MKIQRKVLIKDALWDIKLVKKINDTPEEKYGDALIGLCDPAKQTIWIAKDLSFREKVATLVHELLHAAEEEYEIEIPHDLIYSLQYPIADLLIDNFL